MPEQSSNRFYVGRRVLIEDEEWMITACDFIFDRVLLRKVADIQKPEVGYHGTLKDLALSKIPLGNSENN